MNLLIDRIADRVDLAIDLLTLGQYGLERLDRTDFEQKKTARDAGCEAGARSCDHGGRREALPPARSRGCHAPGRRGRGQTTSFAAIGS